MRARGVLARFADEPADAQPSVCAPAVPGAPITRQPQQQTTPAAPPAPHNGAPKSAPMPGLNMQPVAAPPPARPVKDSIAALNIPASWKRASADDPRYAAYLDAHGDVA